MPVPAKSRPRKPARKKKKASFSIFNILVAFMATLLCVGSIFLILEALNLKQSSLALLAEESPEPSLVPKSLSPSPKVTATVVSPAPVKETVMPKVISVPSQKQEPSKTFAPVPSPKKAPFKGYLFFVLDDAGYNLRQSKRFLELPIPLTLAVMPSLPYSADLAQLAHSKGKCVILHQPMEALNETMTEAGLVSIQDSPERQRTILEENLSSIPWLEGLNNHKGSLGTQNETLMDTTMQVLNERKLFFFDSRTTAQTIAENFAAKYKVPFIKRDIFLDNQPDASEIRKYMEDAKDIAEKRGYAVMIGHVWSDELFDVVLQDYLGIQAEGFQFELLSRFFIATEAETSESRTSL